MKKIVLAVLMLILFVNSASAGSFSEVDEIYSKWTTEKNFEQVPGFGVIAFKDGKEVYSYFGGQRNIEKNLPVTKDTRFRIASVSKMFTVFSIMQLVEQGKINLDEDVSKYLGFKLRNPNFPDEKITVRMLASHTSTLRDGSTYILPQDLSLEEFFKPDGKFFENGAHFADKDKNFFKYSNINYGILGTIIEKVTGERFDIYQKNHIFKDLDIKADYVVGNLGKKEFENLGALYLKKNSEGVWNENGDWYAQVDNYSVKPAKDKFVDEKGVEYDLKNYKIGTNATFLAPQGGLRISFAELANTLEMLMNGGNFHGKQIIRKDLFEEMTKAQWIYDEKTENGDTYGVMFSYGFGFYKIDGGGKARLCEEKEIDYIGHSGEALGLISGIYFVPGKKDGVIFMTNGRAIEVDDDERSYGKFSNGYIWEEKAMNPIGKYIF